MTAKRPGTSRVIGQGKQAAQRSGLPDAEWVRRHEAGLFRCYGCKDWKTREHFNKNSSRVAGHSHICKPCLKRRVAASRYGITLDDLDNLPGANGICPLCEREGQKMHIDHNHSTGAVRGFLCTRCNVGLGQFLDSPAMLARAIAYLEKHDDVT